MKRFRLKLKSKSKERITEYSNIIAYDEMGYPLRLVIVTDKHGRTHQEWLDVAEGSEQKNDMVIKWTNIDN